MKENKAFQVMNLSGESTIAHDDKLLIRSVKSELGLTAEYRHFVNIKKRGTGEAVIVNYILPGETVTSISVEQYEQLEPIEQACYVPQYLRGLELADGVSLEIKNNQVDIRLYNLFDNLGSRYKTALDTMIELETRGILKYSPRADETERNRKEAIRQRLKRKMKPAEYEHDILITGELGRMMYRDLEGLDGVNVLPGTVYITGFKKYKKMETACKFYDVGNRDRQEPGQYYKIEVTLYKQFFKNNGLRVNDITTQAETQNRILERLTGIYGKVISRLKGDTLEALQRELGIQARGRERDIHRTIAIELLKPERTLTERVTALERETEAIKKRLEKLENER